MSNRSGHLTTYTFLIGALFLSLLCNIHYYNKLSRLESESVFWKFGMSRLEFKQIEDEIKRLEQDSINQFTNEKGVSK